MNDLARLSLVDAIAECSRVVGQANWFASILESFDDAQLTLRIDAVDDGERCTASVVMRTADVDRECLREIVLRLRESALDEAMAYAAELAPPRRKKCE